MSPYCSESRPVGVVHTLAPEVFDRCTEKIVPVHANVFQKQWIICNRLLLGPRQPLNYKGQKILEGTSPVLLGIGSRSKTRVGHIQMASEPQTRSEALLH